MSATLGDTAFFCGGTDAAETVARRRRSHQRIARCRWSIPTRRRRSPRRWRGCSRAGESDLCRAFHAERRGAERAGFHEHQCLHARPRRRPSSGAWKGSFHKSVRAGDQKIPAHGIGCTTRGCCQSTRAHRAARAARIAEVICAQTRSAVGINVPIRTVLFTQLCKTTDARRRPERTRLSPDRRTRGTEGFRRLRGRRAGTRHVIENLQLEKKQAGGGRNS